MCNSIPCNQCSNYVVGNENQAMLEKAHDKSESTYKRSKTNYSTKGSQTVITNTSALELLNCESPIPNHGKLNAFFGHDRTKHTDFSANSKVITKGAHSLENTKRQNITLQQASTNIISRTVQFGEYPLIELHLIRKFSFHSLG